MLTARVLRIQTEEEFNAFHDQFIADAKALHVKGFSSRDGFRTSVTGFGFVHRKELHDAVSTQSVFMALLINTSGPRR
jgi:hypothetical protein